MLDDPTLSRIADQAGVPLELAREVAIWVDAQPNVGNEAAMVRSVCLKRKARLEASPAHQQRSDSAGRGSLNSGSPHDYADPAIAHRELAKIRELLGDRRYPAGAPAGTTPTISPEDEF